MAMVRSRRGPVGLVRRGGGGNRLRPVEWTRNQATVLLADGGDVSEILLVDSPKLQEFTSPTIIRIHLELFFDSQGQEVPNSVSLCLGVTQANPSEATPDPTTQREGDRWQWWSCYFLEARGLTDPAEYGVTSWRRTVDIRAMRKVHNQDGRLLLAISTSSGSGSARVSVASSTLIKE